MPNKSPAIFGGTMARTLDKFVGLISPSAQLSRMQSRAKVQFAYDAARNTRERGHPDRLRSPENPLQQRDSIMLMRRSRELMENSGFFLSIRSKLKNYVVGNTRYLPQNGDPMIEGAIKEWWDHWMKNCDATGRFHFLDIIEMLLGSALTDGDHGLAHIVDENFNFTLQGIEADRIGDPHQTSSTDPNYIRGIELHNGRPVNYHIYNRSLTDTYTFETTIPADSFSHYYRPERYDQYRGISAFGAVVGLYQDVRDVRRAEMMAVKWASSKAGVVKTNGASMPESVLDRGFVKNDLGKQISSIAPGEVAYLQPGEDISVITSERPNPNLMNFMESMLHEAALGLDLPYAFVYNLTGITGTPTRLVSEQAKRTFQGWQAHLLRNILEPIKNKAILSGIAQGHIPWHENWEKGKFIFPAHPTVDVGRESAANLNENRQALLSASDIYAERGKDWEEEQNQLAKEASNIIRKAKDVAKKEDVPFDTALNLIQMMTPNGAATGESGNSEDVEKIVRNILEKEKLAQKKSEPIKLNKKDANGQAHGKDGKFAPKGGNSGKGKDVDKKNKKDKTASSHESSSQIQNQNVRATSSRGAIDKNEPAISHTRSESETDAQEQSLTYQERTAQESQRLEYYCSSNGIPTYWYPITEKVDNGGEHDVYYEDEGDRVTKVTRNGEFGNAFNTEGQTASATPSQYLERLNYQNEIFGDDATLEAVNRNKDGELQIITSQTYLDGDHPSKQETNDFMQSSGFTKNGHIWEHMDGTLIADAKPANFIKTSKGISPIDLIIGKKE